LWANILSFLLFLYDILLGRVRERKIGTDVKVQVVFWQGL